MTRDENGRFIKGVSGNPKGRALRVAEDDFKRLIDRAVTITDWIAIIAKAKEQAVRGDNRAREWLADRRYGKAPQPLQHSGEDGGPIVHEVIFTDGSGNGGQSRESDNSAPSRSDQSA